MIQPRPRLLLACASVLVLACSDRKGFADEAGSSTDSSDTAGLSSADTNDEPEPECEPIVQSDGSSSGFELCMSTGAIFRTSAELCVDPFPPSDAKLCAYGTCFSDDDCKQAPYGACELQGHNPTECNCIYGCTSDAECGPGFVCMCDPVDKGTRCIEANCRTDADCPNGSRCELNPSGGWSWELASLHCHGPDDECQSDADCPNSLCAWINERWQCSG